ncbi:MAG: tRNA (5-methylaminomethyl-2-thiouridine)(34)-methyltransferase MnmD [Methylophilaceae bacterium]
MQFAKLQWNQQQPYSLDFDDVYYDSSNGLAETEYVFIQHNQLIERFTSLTKPTFTIIETGFGTGLNFFCAIQHFIDHTPANTTLRFISIERYPLQLDDFIKANQNWPMFSALIDALQTNYGQLKDGLNQFKLCDNRIQLDLWVSDVSECLPQLQTPAGAWFLDGFAPSKNSDMWSEKLFAEISRLSKPNTTFATFTSAGVVRRGLQAAGFKVDKVAGFGKKREMLSGYFFEQPS